MLLVADKELAEHCPKPADTANAYPQFVISGLRDCPRSRMIIPGGSHARCGIQGVGPDVLTAVPERAVEIDRPRSDSDHHCWCRIAPLSGLARGRHAGLGRAV